MERAEKLCEPICGSRAPTGHAAPGALAAVLELNPLGVIVTDGRGRVLYVNQRARTLAKDVPGLLRNHGESLTTSLDDRASAAGHSVLLRLRRADDRPLLVVRRRLGLPAHAPREHAFLIANPNHLEQCYAKTRTTGQCDRLSNPLHLAVPQGDLASTRGARR